MLEPSFSVTGRAFKDSSAGAKYAQVIELRDSGTPTGFDDGDSTRRGLAGADILPGEDKLPTS